MVIHEYKQAIVLLPSSKGENRFKELFSSRTQVEMEHALCSEILKHSPKIPEMKHFDIEKGKK